MAENILFVRPVRVDSIPTEGLEQTIEAGEAERAALAKSDGLVAIRRLVGRFALRREGRGVIRVRGEVHAEATQTCIVSLEPFDVVLDEPVDVRFAPAEREIVGGRAAESKTLDPDGDDAPDPIVDGTIDLGALTAEFLILGLDPYPRKPGVEFSEPGKPEPRDAPEAASDFKPAKN